MDSENKWIILFFVIFCAVGGTCLGLIAVLISGVPISFLFLALLVCSFAGLIQGWFMTQYTRIENPLYRFLLGGWFAVVYGKNWKERAPKVS